MCGQFEILKVPPYRPEGATGDYVEMKQCAACTASFRYRHQAQVLLEHYGRGAPSLAELSGDLRLYEPGTGGPLRPRLARLPGYTASDFTSGAPRGLHDGKRNEDLAQLTFADASFDVVLTSDVLEHVPEPWRAFSEIRRVLEPGGRHIFIIPLRDPMPPTTVVRIAPDGRELLPRAEHEGFDGTWYPVYTDFGADLVERLVSLGFTTELHRAADGLMQQLGLVVFCSTAV